ncbi:hypothetical protein LDENG_00257770 [Lucifuga dentata]|nr:hypothetical protein LDENG_00257770 [Lucifuga dentata]
MAAKLFYRKGFLLLLFNFISTAALEKRFSDFKRCADEECSMLLCRGKAVTDFLGPDCRFLEIKKSETVYVYYKLSGRRADMWAGSVGSRFGYFPKDVLAVNHIYTDKELEVPAEETDFVCFETGYDKFDNYDIASLLGSTVVTEENNSENAGTSDQIQNSEVTQKETTSAKEAAERETENDPDKSEDLDGIPYDKSASLPPLDLAESLTPKVADSDTGAATDTTETGETVLKNVDSEKNETKDILAKPEAEDAPKDDSVSENDPVSVSAGMQIPKLKTTLGTTFDAVTTDDETTSKISPYEEEESDELESHDDDDDDNSDVLIGTPLLSFSKEAADTPAPDSLEEEESLTTTSDVEPTNDEPTNQTSEEKNTQTSHGDTVFSVSEETHVPSLEEDRDDKVISETPQTSEEAKQEIQSLSVESQKEPEKTELVLNNSTTSSSVQAGDEETDSNLDKLLFDYNKTDGELIGQKEDQDEPLRPTDEQMYHKAETDGLDNHQAKILDTEPTDEPIEEEEVPEDLEANSDSAYIQDGNITLEHREDIDNLLEENKMMTDEELPVPETEPKQDLSKEEKQPECSDFKDLNKATSDNNRLSQDDHFTTELEGNNSEHSQPELFVEKTKRPEDEIAEENAKAPLEDEEPEKEELLEDENAVAFSRRDTDKPSPESSRAATLTTSEPEYSDSVLRLSLLRDHFTEESMKRLQRFFSLKNLFKVEDMFSNLETGLQAARLSHTGTTQDIENSLESILEASENAILDEIEKMLDNREQKHSDDQQMDTSIMDEETEILDDFQELAFSLRQKYSATSDSTPLASDVDEEEPEWKIEEGQSHADEDSFDNLSENESDDNLTVTDLNKRPENEEEQIVLDEVHSGPDISVEEDGGHFNKNKDNQPSFSVSDEMQKVPQATLENPFDMNLGVEVEHSPSGSLDSVESGSDIREEELGLFSTGVIYTVCVFAMIKTKVAEWMVVIISLLPEEWKPGETMFGCPWQTVVVTALVGVVTFTLFFWRTILAVKKRAYLVDEKKLKEQIQALKKEKTDALSRMAELQTLSEELKEKQKQSEKKTTCTTKRIQELESKVSEAQMRNEQMVEEKTTFAQLLEEERASSLKNETQIEKLEKANEKLQLSRKKTQEALSKTAVLLDEAKLREDARNVQHKCLERDYATLKEENKTLKATIKGWEDKHKELNEQIKVHQKSLKELEDSVVLKDHNVEVLSDLLADLDASDLQKSDSKALANGEVAPDKKTIVKNRIKQMMDVSRIQTTLTVVEEERDRFMSKLLNEEKSRKMLEEQHRELEHAIAALKSEKSHVENQFKVLQQKNEIMVEMYQQKENALQQKLTKEELERRSKESLLSEVGGKAVEAEEQVKVLRQRINEMEEQMKKTEEVYKEQIKEQENKTHSNWVNARNAERALNQEKLETSKLREKLAVLTSQLNERRAPLLRPSPGQTGPRQGDSYGPSPVSGDAPSPPPMIEGPRRPPSAPLGRRIDPYGPRPPSDPHGRYTENRHTSGIDMMGPRSSSPASMDGTKESVDPQAEASIESPEPGPGSFIVSPIRDSPGPLVQGPPVPGPHDPLLPPGRLPPPGPHRAARPNQGPHGPLYPPPVGMTGPLGPPPPNVPSHGPPLPANGHPGMPLPGPLGDFGPRPANGHAFRPRLGPDPRGLPPPHFRPPPPHQFGPMPPPHGVRGPMGPRPPFPPDLRFPGPRDHPYPPADMPLGVPPLPRQGDTFVQAPHDALQNSVGSHAGPGQNLPPQREAPQDSARPAMAEP